MRRRARGRLSEDALDREIQGHLTSARRYLGRAVDACVRVRRGGQPRHLNRKAYRQLMGLLDRVQQVRSVVPPKVDDPDVYPVELESQVRDIESYMRRANRALREAEDMLRRAEESFNEVGATFADREISAVSDTEDEVRRIVMGLESFRGLRPSGVEIEEEPIRRGRQREPRVRKTVPVPPVQSGPPVE